MADESLYDLAGRKEEAKERADEEELFMQMKVVSLDDRKIVKCESCVRDECPRSVESSRSDVSWRFDVSSLSVESSRSDVSSRSDESSSSDESSRLERELFELHERARQFREHARPWYDKVAVFLCFVCEMYVCAECLSKHRGHDGMKMERKENTENGKQREKERNERRGKRSKRMRVEAESEREREREKNESERMTERLHAKKLWDDVMNESETESEEKFKTNKVSIIDRVDVKHELDRTDWDITGLCGLKNKRLVVCDWNNFCIKIFKLGSLVIQRYIRFVGCERFIGSRRFVETKPRDVTEIDLKQNSTEPNLVSGSSFDHSVTDRADPNKQCLIAVTLPRKRQIMFIDLSKKPAKTQKIIQTERECWSIQFYDGKIFTACVEDPGSHWSIYILSAEGGTLSKFHIGIYGYPYLAVVSGRVYITDVYKNRVQCRNVEGQIILEIKIERSGPAGISVDPDNNVYVCAHGHNKVYKLDADLTRYMSVLDQTTDYIAGLRALCYYRDKLFFSHWPPSLHNFVTVVRLL